MKKWLLLLYILFSATNLVHGQNFRPKGYWHQEQVIENGDTIVNIHILPVYVFERGIDRRKYWLLVKSVKAVYPLAQTARKKMAEMEDELAALPTKREQKAFVKTIYDEIKEEYTPVLKRMTRTQGRVLLKLIDRETEYTAYNILSEFRGQFIAGFWQGVSKIFGQDLKSEYGEAEEDKIIEQIVIYYEAGLL